MVAMGLFWYHMADERIRGHAEEALERLTGGDADIEYASLEVLRSITIEGLRIYLPDRPHKPENLIFSAHEVILQHEPKSLLQKQLRLEKIIADKAELNIWYDRDRKLTNLHLLNLNAPSESGPKRPVFILRNGTINYSEISNSQKNKPVTQNVSGQITPDAYSLQIYDFEFSSNKPGLFKNYSIKGSYDLATQQFTTRSQIMLEEIDPNSIPASLANWRRLYEAVKPTGQVQTISTYKPVAGHAFRIALVDTSLYLPWLDNQYPLLLNNVNGQIVCANESITFENLTSTFGSHGSLLLNGNINGYHAAAAFALDLELQDMEIPANQWSGQKSDAAAGRQENPPDDTAIRLQTTLSALMKMMPATAKEFIDTIKPTGRIGLRLKLKRQQDGQGVTTCEGKLSFHDIAILYHYFPYPVAGLAGPVDFNDERIIIGPLHSQQGSQEVTIQGTYYHEPQKEGFAGTVQIKNLPLNQQVYEATGPHYQKIWDRLRPGGTVSVLWRNYFDESSKVTSAMDVELFGAVDVRPDKFQLPLNNIVGNVHWQPGIVNVDVSRADFASGTMALAGSLHIDQAKPSVDCEFEFKDLLLNEKLADCLEGQIQGLLKSTNAGGSISGSGYLKGIVSEAAADSNVRVPIIPSDYQLNFSVRNGSFNHVDFPYPLEQVEARCELTAQGIKIDDLQGCQGASRVKLRGTIASENQYNLYLYCNPLELDEKLHQLFVRRNWGIWQQMNPSGAVRLSLLATRDAEATKPSYQVSIEPLGVRLCPSFFNYPLTNITGRTSARGGIVTIDNLVCQQGEGQIILQGEFTHDSQRRDSKLNIQAVNLDIDEKLYQAVCEKIFRNSSAQSLRRLNLTGKLDADVNLTGSGQGQSINNWDFDGAATVSHGHMDAPANTEDIAAKVTGGGSYDNATGTCRFEGKLFDATMLVRSRRLSELTSTVKYTGDTGGLAFGDIVGQFCGGRMAGDCQLIPGESSTGYKLDLQFLGADIAQVVKSGSRYAQRYPKLRGKLDGMVSLFQPGNNEIRRGQFSFRIKEGILGELPVAAQLLHVLNLSLPKEGAFNEAYISGDIIGQKSHLEEIALRGSALSLSGAGVMTGTFLDLTREYDPKGITDKLSGGSDSDTQVPGHLDLVFAVDAPGYLAGIPGLSSLYKAVQPELMQLQVSGVLDNLEVNTTAFPSLSEALGQGEKPSKKKSQPKPIPIPQAH